MFSAVSVAAAAAAAAAFNFQILATSSDGSEGLDFAELAPPAPDLQVVESADGTKTVIAYVTKTAAGEVIIKTLPAVTVFATPTGPGLPTTDAGATSTGSPTVAPTGGPTVQPAETGTASTSAPAVSTTPVATPAPTDTPTPQLT
jgi:hypothetical protein